MAVTAEMREDERTALVPNWHESLYGVDLALLLSSPVYFGAGVPQGDGSAVLLIPGFMNGDGYLFFLYSWLLRLRYRPFFSGIGFNANCPNVLIEDVLDPVLKEAYGTGESKVHLLGHSLGGVFARSLAAQHPDQIASVITLGSPLRQAVVQKKVFYESEIVRQYVVAQYSDRVRPECMTSDCGCPFMKALRKPLSPRVRITSIYTRHDGLLDWRSCRTGNPSIDVEVPGTHSGLAFNPTVYKVIAQRLAAVASR